MIEKIRFGTHGQTDYRVTAGDKLWPESPCAGLALCHHHGVTGELVWSVYDTFRGGHPVHKDVGRRAAINALLALARKYPHSAA